MSTTQFTTIWKQRKKSKGMGEKLDCIESKLLQWPSDKKVKAKTIRRIVSQSTWRVLWKRTKNGNCCEQDVKNERLIKNEPRKKTSSQIKVDKITDELIWSILEQFITNAYREKLKEMKEAEEEEARMDKIEEIMDVTKQKDMSGFYK